MGIPVGLFGAVVLGVVFREEGVGDDGGEDGVHKGVEGGGAEDFVDVQRESGEVKGVGVGLDPG